MRTRSAFGSEVTRRTRRVVGDIFAALGGDPASAAVVEHLRPRRASGID